MIKKIDYYVGSFVSFLLTHSITPALFEGSDNSKIVTFDTDHRSFNLYVKYCSAPTNTKLKKKSYQNWTVLFTENELKLFKEHPQTGKENLLVVICTEPELTKTKVAVLSIDEAMKCMGNDSINKKRNIKIKLAKSAHNFECHGTGLSDINSIKITTQFTLFFKMEEYTNA